MRQSGQEDVENRSSLGLVAAAIGSVSAGVVYALVVNHVERTRWMENRSSLFVALGVAATLLLRRLLPGAGNIYMDFLAFFFTGVPMITNQMVKLWRLSKQFQATKQERGKRYDRSNGLAHARERG